MISVKILNKPKSNRTSSRSMTSVASVSKATVADHASFSDQAEYANRAGYASRAAYADQAGSLASYESMDSRYLSKTDDDTASGLITFLKGLLTGNFQTGVNNSGASINELGAAEFQSVKVRDFIQAFSATIANITADNLTVNTLLTALEAAITTLTVRDLTVTGVAHFFKLVIDELKSVGGMVMITAANATIYRVETLSNGNYKCYFRSTDGDRRIYNQFEVGDGAICQTFDVAEGTSYNVSNKYYWRRVTDVGSETIDGVETHYITLSYNDCASGSGTPAAGDEVAQLGYYATGTLSDDQKARQSAIVISSYNSNDPGVKAPYFAQYSGINDFDLASHRLNWIARNGIQMTGVFKSIVDGQERNIIDILDDLANQFEAIKGQVDNKFDIWYGHGVPTLNNEPASAWSSSEYESHLQDIYYDLDKEAASDGGNCYRFSHSNSQGYYWDKVTDAKTLSVLEKISDVASDGILSGGMEKVRIYIEWMAAVSDYSYYLQQVTTMGLTMDNVWLTYVDALEDLGTFLSGGTTWTVSSLPAVPTWINDANRSVTTGTPDNPISASEYRTVWTDYYEAYAALLQKLGVTTYNISNERTKVFVTAQSVSSNPVPPDTDIQGETPTPPYKAGDFWLYTLLTGEQKLFICTTNQASAYSPSHWQDMSDVVVSSDIRYNMRMAMDKLADDDAFVTWYSKAEVVNNGYIQVIICDSVSEAGHYYYNNGTIYDGETDNEVTPVLASLAVVGSTVYQYRDVTVDRVTTRQWVDMNISDLPVCLLTIYAGTLETAWKIYRALANNAAEHSGAMAPNTFTAQFAAATEALPNQKKTITANGYLYYYQNGDAWEPLGDNQDHSVIQNLGDAIVMAVWGEDSSSQIAINRRSISALTTWQGTVNGQIANLNTGLAAKVDVNGSGATAFSKLYADAVSNDGTIQKKAEMITYVQKYTENGQDYLESGVKIKGDKIILEGATTVNGNFSIDQAGNVDVKGTVKADILYRSVGVVQLSSSTPVVYDGTYDVIWLIGKGNFQLGNPANHKGRIVEIHGYSETNNSYYEPVVSVYDKDRNSSNFQYIEWFGLPSGVVSTLACVYMYITTSVSFPGKPKAVFYSDGDYWYLMERGANTSIG